MPIDRILLCLTALAGAALYSDLAAGQAGVAEYLAVYDVRHKGRRIAETEFSVVAEGNNQYLYSSSTAARGLLKLLSPNPAIERSRMSVAGSRILPIHFDFMDGSRKGEDSYSIAFDATRGEVRITRPVGTEILPLEPNLLDRGSLQVALMRDLANCTLPGPYRWVDEDGIRTYRYERLEDARADTGAGSFAAVRFSQQREGSSRNTILWLAADLGFLPVLVEQIEAGESQTVYSLESVTGIVPRTSECSGFR
jgi:hypothetical protein